MLNVELLVFVMQGNCKGIPVIYLNILQVALGRKRRKHLQDRKRISWLEGFGLLAAISSRYKSAEKVGRIVPILCSCEFTALCLDHS